MCGIVLCAVIFMPFICFFSGFSNASGLISVVVKQSSNYFKKVGLLVTNTYNNTYNI